MDKVGSGIRDKHPGFATLAEDLLQKYFLPLGKLI